MRVPFLILILSIFFSTFTDAQHRKCYSDEHTANLMKDAEYAKDFRKRLAAFNAKSSETTAEARSNCTNTVTIPVAIHFQNTNTNDRACLESLVNQQIARLNADFQGTNEDIGSWKNSAAAYFPGVSNGEMCVNFCVATRNHPNGFGLNDGQMAITINRFSGDSNSSWAGYVNIFVMDLGNNLLGYSPLGGRGNGDGVVIGKHAFGGAGACGDISSASTLDRGRTLTHELGHYLFLYHVWGNVENCNFDDGLEDTPTCDAPNFYCPSLGKSSCGTVDMHMNYMDYVNDECMYMFSAQQAARMDSWLKSNLNNVLNNAANVCSAVVATCDDNIQNGDETGVDCGGDCAPCDIPPTCDDNIQNGNEIGVDCGGDCAPCDTPPTCDDGIQNGIETGIDCGGDCMPCDPEPADCAQNAVSISIFTDLYGSETTWNVKDENGTIVANGGPYTDFSQTEIMVDLCLPTACYTFNIYDAFGDGICCEWGNGLYMITDGEGVPLAEGGSFGFIETKMFNAGAADCGELPPPSVCAPPTTSNVTYYTDLTRVKVLWDAVPDANRYTVRYREVGTNAWRSTSTGRLNKVLRRLKTGTDYEYRIRSRCPEGWTEYSDLRMFSTLSGRVPGGITLYEYEEITVNHLFPNPAADVLKIDYSLEVEGEVEIVVYDMLGRQVLYQKEYQEDGSQKVSLDVSGLQGGTHLIQIRTEEEQLVKKFIKK